MEFFDSHAHYNDEKFDIDREEIISQTLSNGVSNFIVAGYNLDSSKKAVKIAGDYESVYAIVGICAVVNIMLLFMDLGDHYEHHSHHHDHHKNLRVD